MNLLDAAQQSLQNEMYANLMKCETKDYFRDLYLRNRLWTENCWRVKLDMQCCQISILKEDYKDDSIVFQVILI